MQLSLEVEYPAPHYATNETVFFRSFVYALGFPQNSATVIYGDNAIAIQLNREHRVIHDNIHINMKYHNIRWTTNQGVCTYEHVPNAHNVVDILGTKVLLDKATCYGCQSYEL